MCVFVCVCGCVYCMEAGAICEKGLTPSITGRQSRPQKKQYFLVSKTKARIRTFSRIHFSCKWCLISHKAIVYNT